MHHLLCKFLAIGFKNVFLTNFQTFIFFVPKSREVTPQNLLYLIFWPESDFFCIKRRRIDVRRVMPSFMSISPRVQELFRKNRGGGGRDKPPPPRWSRVKVKYFHPAICWPSIWSFAHRRAKRKRRLIPVKNHYETTSVIFWLRSKLRSSLPRLCRFLMTSYWQKETDVESCNFGRLRLRVTFRLRLRIQVKCSGGSGSVHPKHDSSIFIKMES